MARGLSALLGAMVIAGSCAADPTLDPQSVTTGLGEVLFAADPSIPSEIACPAPDPELIAQALVCTAVLHGEAITIDVEIDEQGAATAAVRERLLSLDEVAADLAERLAEDLGIEPEVDCPGLFVVDLVGVAFVCTASHDDRPLTLQIDIVDDDSNWEVTFLP